MISADYSYDGVTWTSVAAAMDRDPAIKACTVADVLKFDQGTTGLEPLYIRITLDDQFETNTWATCYIKTGGGRNGCNMYYYHGVAGPKLD